MEEVYYPAKIKADSTDPVVEKAQHEPH